MSLKFEVRRSVESYNFRVKQGVDSFANNWKNNSKDWLVLLDDNAELYRCRCQSVANYCFGDMTPGDTVEHGDTIAEGEFTVKCFVDPRAFHGEIHAITQTKDIDGQWINHEAMQTTKDGYQNGRWLIHDRYSFKTGEDTSYAWSAGCFIVSSNDLEGLNMILHAYKIQPNDLIKGEVIEYDRVRDEDF